MDRSEEILLAVRSLSATMTALLEALAPGEEEGDPVTSLSEVLELVGEAVNRQADAITHLRSDMATLRAQVAGLMREPA